MISSIPSPSCHSGFGPSPPPETSYFRLLRFSSIQDKFSLLFGWIVAISSGFVIPLININFGHMIDVYAQFDNLSDYHQHLLELPPDQLTIHSELEKIPKELQNFRSRSFSIAFNILAIGFVYFFLCYFFTFVLDCVSARIVNRIRIAYYECLLKHEVAWMDDDIPLDVCHQIEGDLKMMEEGIGSKTGYFLYVLSTSVFSLLTAVYYGWELTFVLLALTPLFGVFNSLIATSHIVRYEAARNATLHANNFGMATIRDIRHILSRSTQAKSIDEFEGCLRDEVTASTRASLTSSLAHGLLWLSNYLTYALGAWYGSKLIIVSRETNMATTYTIGKIILIFWSVLSINYYATRTGPFLELFKSAMKSASYVYRFIDRESLSHARGMRPNQLEGRLTFDQVSLSLHTSPEVRVVRLQNLSFSLLPGQTLSIIGSGQSGMSLLPFLLSRFLEQDSGDILMGDVDIRHLNLQWLRSNVAFVGRHPVIFDGSVFNNIWMADKSSTRMEVEDAAKVTNCQSFIDRLDYKLETIIGAKGRRLTVGQKQKINLAKAIIKRPMFLILDRVTSDIEDEDESDDIQLVVERIRLGRTTIIISDYISMNVKNSDRIIVLEDGKVMEDGSHDDLMSRHGKYRQMVTRSYLKTESSSHPTSSSSSVFHPSKGLVSISEEKEEKKEVAFNEARVDDDEEGGKKKDEREMEDGRKYFLFSPSLSSLLRMSPKSKNEEDEKKVSDRKTDDEDEREKRKDIHVAFADDDDDDNDDKSRSCQDEMTLKDEQLKKKEHPFNWVEKKDLPSSGKAEEVDHVMSWNQPSQEVKTTNSSSFENGPFKKGRKSTGYPESLQRDSFLSSHYTHKYSVFRISSMMKSDFPLILVGCTFSAIFGLGVPAYAIIVGDFMQVLSSNDSDVVLTETKIVSYAFILLSIFISLSSFISSYCLDIVSIRLSKRFKASCLKSILTQDLSWFEDDDNHLEPFERNVFTESDMVSTAITSRLSSISQTVGTVLACIILSFYLHWKMACVVLSLMPFILFRSSLISGGSQSPPEKGSSLTRQEDGLSQSISLQVGSFDDAQSWTKETTSSRVLHSVKESSCLQQEGLMRSIFSPILDHQVKLREGILHMKSQSFGVIQCIPVIAYGVVYLFASHFILQKDIHYTLVFKLVEGVIFASILLSEESLFTETFDEAKKMIGHLLHIIDCSASGFSSSEKIPPSY